MEFLAALHSKIIHFPIAILILYSLFEILGVLFKKEFLQKSAHLLLAIGVIISIAAVLTGNQAAEAAELIKNKISTYPAAQIEEHETYATITLWYFFALLIFRTYLVLKKKFKGALLYLFIPLVLVGSFFIYETGNLGGKLVYKYGIGTEVIKKENSSIIDD